MYSQKQAGIEDTTRSQILASKSGSGARNRIWFCRLFLLDGERHLNGTGF
jgi:hypothetical protein